MSLPDADRPLLTVDGELLTDREALNVPIAVRAGTAGDEAALEFEAHFAGASNRTVRLSNLAPTELRVLRDELDRLLGQVDE